MNEITEFNPVDHVRLIQEKTGAIQQLSGFQKHHRVSTSRGSGNLQFLTDVAAHELDADLQATFSSLRSAFGFKRRQVTVTEPEFRCGVIATPYFNYEITVEPLEDNPSNILWRHAITGIRDPSQVFSDSFFSVFGNRFNILELSTRDPVEIESLVDQVEDAESSAVTVDYDKDLTWCAIRIDQSDETVKIAENGIRIVSDREVSPLELLQAFLKFQQEFNTNLQVESSPFLHDRDRSC